MLDVLVHIDAEDLAYVYDWRLEQEHWLIATKGQGMSDEAVRKFVDGCKCCF
jgi:D-glycerate 3-kinase